MHANVVTLSEIHNVLFLHSNKMQFHKLPQPNLGYKVWERPQLTSFSSAFAEPLVILIKILKIKIPQRWLLKHINSTFISNSWTHLQFWLSTITNNAGNFKSQRWLEHGAKRLQTQWKIQTEYSLLINWPLLKSKVRFRLSKAAGSRNICTHFIQ